MTPLADRSRPADARDGRRRRTGRSGHALGGTSNTTERKPIYLVGISGEPNDVLARYAVRHHLRYSLVSDPAGRLASAFGVTVHEGRPDAQTFIVGDDGMLAKIYRTIDPAKEHASAVAADVGAR